MALWERLAGAVPAGVFLAATSATAQTAEIETHADWKRRPSSESVAEHYPVIAQVLAMQGQVVLSCTVDINGRSTPCAVARESPSALGFGRAALELAETFEFHPAFANGAPKPSEVRLPVTFDLPKEEAPPPPPAIPAAQRKLVASVVEAWSKEDFTNWMLGRTFETMTMDAKVDELIRTSAINRLFTAGVAHEPQLRAATIDAYSAYLPRRTIDALVAWSKGDQTLPSPEFGDEATEKIVLHLAPIMMDIRVDARKSLCELVDCRSPASSPMLAPEP